MKKLIRITTVPLSLDKLLEGQLGFMKDTYDVIAVSSDKEYLKKIAQREGVSYFELEMTRKITPLKDLKAMYLLYRFLKKEKPFIVHSHTPKAGFVGMVASFLAKVPHRLHTVAGLPLMEAVGIKRSILNSVETFTYRCANRVYPNSKGLYDFIIQSKFASPNKLKIIGNGSSNGIDTSYFDPSLYSPESSTMLKRELGIPEEDFIFIFVGRLVGDKGINELVTAFEKVHSVNKQTSLVLVGSLESDLDPLKDKVLHSIQEHSKIYSLGFKKDVRPYFALAKVLVFPSYREGFPNVVMQAGAMGLPAIVSDINGCNEIITKDINGLIIPPKNTDALTAAMNSILDEMKENINTRDFYREHIASNYKREEMWKTILCEYQQLTLSE